MSTRTRRHWLQASLASAVGATVASSWPASQALAQPSAKAAPLETLRIGIATGGVGNPVRHGGNTLALLRNSGVLEREFAAEGCKVEWIFFKGSGPAVNEALVNQQLDLAWQGDLPSILHRAAGVKTRILAGSGVRSGLFLGVPKGSPIKQLAELRGKRVAVFKGTNMHLAALRALSAHGLQESDVRLINLDAAAALSALATKDIDAAFGYVELFLLRDQGLGQVVWSAQADSYRFTRQLAVLGTERFVNDHPQATQRVITALVKCAHAWADEARRKELFDEWGKAELPEALWREDFIGQPLKARLSPLLDPFLIARYQDAADEALRLKLIRKAPDLKGWFEPRFVNTALKQLKLEGAFPAYGAQGELLGQLPSGKA